VVVLEPEAEPFDRLGGVDELVSDENGEDASW
jgi:hypothetical protein